MALSMKALPAKAAVSRGFLGRRVAPVANGSRTVMRAGNWLPGADAPSWLPDDLAGNYGFDPLGLAKDKASLQRFTEAELIHCRWAMLGVVGCLSVELLGFGNWVDAQQWATTSGTGGATYFGIANPIDLNTLNAIFFLGFATSESRRWEETDPAKKCYPGGAFDPLGFSKDAAKQAEWRLKEVKNGRLAMLACLGFQSQWAATGKGPVANLAEHLSDPWHINFATNGVSVPFF